MDFDLLARSPRWDLLELLARTPSSPVELSKHLNTSVSYVSQQLKLLEAANLITKQKTGNAEKGKPRYLYTLSKEILQVTALLRTSATKKTISLSEYHKTILRIWLIDSPLLHHPLEKLYWKLESDLSLIEAFFVIMGEKPEVYCVTDSKKVSKLVTDLNDHFNIIFRLHAATRAQLHSLLENNRSKQIHPLYDPHLLLPYSVKSMEVVA